MAPITFNATDTAHQAEPLRRRLEAVSAVLRGLLDAFVSYRMRLVAAESENAHPRQARAASSTNLR